MGRESMGSHGQVEIITNNLLLKTFGAANKGLGGIIFSLFLGAGGIIFNI